MKKRTICLLLAMIMVLSIVLAGCSKTAETPAADETPATTEPAETTDNTETPEAPEETAEPALEQKTIQLMITGAGKQANSDKVWAAFNEQLQQYVPNTTVEFIDVPFEEYSEKFSQVLASGEGVDLAWTGWLINKPQNIADGNLICRSTICSQSTARASWISSAKMSLKSIAMRLTASCTTSPAGRACAASAAAGSS